MKKTYIAHFFVLLFLLSMLLLPTSCRQKNISASLSKMAPADIETEELDLKDSERFNGGIISSTIKADYPTDGCFLAVNSIQEWISEMLGGTYTGKVADGKKMLKYYLQEKVDFCKEFMDEKPIDIEYSFDVEVSKKYETENFVTYQYVQGAYLGGAHGSQYVVGQTFRKYDGRRMDWNVFRSDRMDDVRELVSNTIQKDFFEMDDKEFQGLKEDFMNGYFPLPQTMPVFLEKGVLFQYQAYEIAPYAAGSPQCIIPYAALDTLFSNTGKALLGGEAIAVK